MVTKQSHLRHYLVVATGCMMMMAGTGITFSSAGIFFKPVSTGLGIGIGTLAIYMTITLLTAFLVLPFAGKMIATKDARVLLSVATLMIGGGLIVFSFAKSVWYFYLAAPLLGLGFAFTGYLGIPTLLNRWFKTRVGFFMGICMAFSGIGGVIFNPIGGQLIAAYGWAFTYRVFGIIVIALMLPFTLFAIRNYPSDLGLKPYGGDEAGAPGVPKAAIIGVSSATAMKSSPFWALVAVTALIGLGGTLYQFMPAYASSLPLGKALPALAATLASAAMLGQAVGKLGLGVFADKSVLGAFTTSTVSGAVGIAILWLVPSSSMLVLGAGFLFGLFYASGLVLVPLATRQVFGNRDYALIYSKVSMASALASAFAATIWGMLIQATKGYSALWPIGLALVAACLLLVVYALKAGRRLEHTPSQLDLQPQGVGSDA